MVTGVTNPNYANNLSFSKNAVKYLQDGKLSEDSLGKQVKDSALGSLPMGAIFGAGIPAISAARYVKKNPGTKFGDVFKQKVVDSSGLASGAPKEPGKIAKFLKLDKLSNWFKNTKLGKTKLSKAEKKSWQTATKLWIKEVRTPGLAKVKGFKA